MTGENTMELNEATMKRAVQHYFDTVLFRTGNSPTIESVKAPESKYGGCFAVVLSDAREPAEENK